jgi:hypothetical protein
VEWGWEADGESLRCAVWKERQGRVIIGLRVAISQADSSSSTLPSRLLDGNWELDLKIYTEHTNSLAANSSQASDQDIMADRKFYQLSKLLLS